MDKKTISIGVVIVAVLLVVGGIYYFSTKGGSSIKGEAYTNESYGFKMTMPDSWKGFTMIEDVWNGWPVGGDAKLGEEYQGPKLIFRNDKWKPLEVWQDIPILVFTKDVWALVMKGDVMASSSPILPEKIGENSNFIFATPPRWTLNNDPGAEEAIEIVKTFKTFQVNLIE